MKRCLLGLIALVLLVAPAAAPAQEPAACQFTTQGDPGEEFGRMGQLAQPIAAELETWLGGQFAVFWLQARENRWYVGLAPGPIRSEELRDRAYDLIDARYDGADAQMLRERFAVSEQPYGQPELRRIQDELTAEAIERRWGVGWGSGVSCEHTDAWRVYLELYSDATPEIVEEARRLAEPYGDKVRVVHHPDVGPPMVQSFAAPARGPKLAQLVRPRGCKVVLRRSARALVRSLKVRRRGGRALVRVRLKDGRNLSGTVRLRSCARS